MIARALPFALLVAMTGCSRLAEAPPRRVSLPGFSIELPASHSSHTSGTATGGKHVVVLPLPSFSDLLRRSEVSQRELEVRWTTTHITHEQWSTMLLPTLMKQMPGTDDVKKLVSEESLNGSGWLSMVRSALGNVGVAFVSCEDTFDVIITYVRYTNLQRQTSALREIASSVQCALEDANRVNPVIATRLPAKFGRVADPAAQVYQSLDGERMAFNTAPGDLRRTDAHHRSLLDTAASLRFGVEARSVEIADLTDGDMIVPPRSLTRMREPGTGAAIYFGTLYCAKQELTIVSFWEAVEPSDRVAKERLAQFGCPGEATTQTPSFESLLEAACAAGSADACALRAPSASSPPALVPSAAPSTAAR